MGHQKLTEENLVTGVRLQHSTRKSLAKPVRKLMSQSPQQERPENY